MPGTGLLQRTATGQIKARYTGAALLNSDGTCCCEGQEQPPTDCGLFYSEDCESGAFAPQVYRVVISGTSRCYACMTPAEAGSVAITGGVNRTFYVSGYPVSGGVAYTGVFLMGPHSNAVNPWRLRVHNTPDCTGAPIHDIDDVAAGYTAGFYKLSFSAAYDVGSGQQGISVSLPDIPQFTFIECEFFAGFGGAAVNNFCSRVTSVVNANTVCAQPVGASVTGVSATGGTAEFTPCPPCAVDCGYHPCAAVTQTIGSGSTAVGEYEFVRSGPWQGWSTIPRWEMFDPAGCVWTYFKHGDPASHEIHVWFDGADWRGYLVEYLSGGRGKIGNIDAADLVCTNNKLSGTIVFETPDGLLGLEATFGNCGPAEDCCTTYNVQPNYAYGGFYEMSSPRVWLGIGTSIIEERSGKWYMSFDASNPFGPEPPGDIGEWESALSSCPSDNPADWTKIGGGPGYDNPPFAITKSGCP